MSLLDRRAPHRVQVQNRAMTRDMRGMQVFDPDGDPVTVRCMVEPVRDWASSEEDQTLGLQVIDMAVIRSRTWPGDVNSHITYEGGLYETVGVPQRFHAGRRTQHWRITVKWIKEVG